MKFFNKIGLVSLKTLSILLLAGSAQAMVVLPEVITNNMVLQQKDETIFWGKANQGKDLGIVTSWNNKKYTVRVGSDGAWKLKISTPVAGGPYTISFNDGDLVTLKNIMIGEVWLCSGQSNMEMPLGGWGKIKDYQQEIANANYPQIRILKVKKAISNTPTQDFKTNTMGWQECSPSTIAEFSAAAYFFARNIIKDKNVAIGLIDATWGGTVVESWTSAEGNPNLPAANPPKEAVPTNPNQPNLLYNAMIHPLIQVGIKGVIWYQGESNNSRAYQYRELFPLVIKNWRNKFNRPNLPFIFVQLANYLPELPEPGESTWAELREAQAMALTLPNTGMAVAIDLGETKDIHPKNKQEVGRRLALVALAKVYKQKVAYSGPMYQSAKLEGNQMVLSFEHVEGGLKTQNGGDIKGFAVAGADKKFYWASATIKDNKVIVAAKEVPHPVAVRYAWANNPVCNLTNETGLPTIPFRTDDWQGITFNKR